MELHHLQEWTRRHQRLIQEDYFHFLRFRTISADPSCREEMSRCAEWLVAYLERLGFSARMIPTSGAPLVYAEEMTAGPNCPVLLIYGHYDVQPVDPIELWKSDPFMPELREGNVYARGANDDKGQILFAILAMRLWKELGHSLPVNVKFCIEGEEESSSTGLSQLLPSMKDVLRADDLLVVDCGMLDETTPAVTLGGRGILTLDVTLTGSSRDLHSGLLGGIAYNPNRALVELLAQLWDEKGRVAIPGFYEAVSACSAADREAFTFRQNREDYRREFGITAFGGEEGLSLQEAKWFRPTIEINGMTGGYVGQGFKTVIPATAYAKISCRLVPNQDPEDIERKLIAFLTARVKQGIQIGCVPLGRGAAFRGDPHSHGVHALHRAYFDVTGCDACNILSGGSIPIVADLASVSQAKVVGMGYGLPGDGIHAPNEHFGWDRFEKGIWTVAKMIEGLAAHECSCAT